MGTLHRSLLQNTQQSPQTRPSPSGGFEITHARTHAHTQWVGFIWKSDGHIAQISTSKHTTITRVQTFSFPRFRDHARTHAHTQWVGFLWTSDGHIAQISTSKHTTITRVQAFSFPRFRDHTRTHARTHTQWVGFLWTSDGHIAQISTSKHTTITTDKTSKPQAGF